MNINVEQIRSGAYRIMVEIDNRHLSILLVKQNGKYHFVLAKDLDEENCYLSDDQHNDLVGIIKNSMNPDLKEILQLT
jgi:predicted double-glycine peptidase